MSALPAKKIEPQACRRCGAAPRVDHQGTRWKVVCSANKSGLSKCQSEGHTMLSRKEAVRVWNELK